MALDLLSGEMVPCRCLANSCPFCGPLNARMVGGAIAMAEPERWGMLTQVGNNWQETRHRMKNLTYRLRAEAGKPFEWCWHIEPNPAGTGHHCHYWQHGRYVPQTLLSATASALGMGEVCTIQRWRPSKKAITYGLKLAGVTYGLKLAEAEESLEGYLEANGNRLVHASRGFWKDQDGERVGQREAMKAWAKRNGEVEREWVVIRKTAVGEVG